VIVSKKEFSDLKLSPIEPTPEPREQFNHQKIIARFLSSLTPYNELLLYHEMGTGKTCTAISCIEKIRYEKNGFEGAMVFARGTGLLENFVQELLFKCTGGKYLPEDQKELTAHRTKKIVSEYYYLNTFTRFAKLLKKEYPDSRIRKEFSNHIIVIDEVHNLRLKDDKEEEDLDIYNQFYRFLHTVSNCKILLMSGTPMKDVPSEIASVMNLILPKELEFDADSFMDDYFEGEDFKPEMIDDFTRRVRGRVSYLKAMTSTIRKVYIGQTIGTLQHFKVYPDNMSEFQGEVYLEAYERDKAEKSIFVNSRQASLFVFPDGSYGREGSDRYILTRKIKTSKGSRTTYQMNPELSRAINGKIENLERLSSKYAQLVRMILENPDKKMLIYSEFVIGSGSILLGLILQHFGINKATGKESNQARRYAILTNKTATPKEIQRLINRFNDGDNTRGEYLSVIIGSRVISEGFTLKNVAKEFILTPHWNYSETSQAIARGWRVGSHTIDYEDDKIEIYQLVSLPPRHLTLSDGNPLPSIDLNMYEISERKDISMKKIEYIIKIGAFDCPLNIDRNMITGYDGMRECDYENCQYKCQGKIGSPDVITYNLYHSLEGLVGEKLTHYFKTKFSIESEALFNLMGEFTRFEVNHALKNLIDKNIIFKDRYGFNNYLRQQNNVYFLSPSISKDVSFFTKFYAEELVVSASASFEEIVHKFGEENIPEKLGQIFKYPEYTSIIIETLPDEIQMLLLQFSISAMVMKIDKNTEVREKILSYFQGSYKQFQDKWIVKYTQFSDEAWCIDINRPMDWKICPEGENILEAAASEKREVLFNSPIGYYGIYNPKLDKFCVRDVQNRKKGQKDLRKLKVGQICKHFHRNVLVDIAARRMELEPPQDYLQNMSRDDLKELISTSKYTVPEDLLDSVSDQDMRRILFWNNKNKPETCRYMREWFEEKGLMEESGDCGIQGKNRSKSK
jgi:superfamily II DNA or RNA helicase